MLYLGGFLLLFFFILLAGFLGHRWPYLWPLPAAGTFAAACWVTPGGIGSFHSGWTLHLVGGFLIGLLWQTAYLVAMLRGRFVTFGTHHPVRYLLTQLWRSLIVSCYIGFAEESVFRRYLFAVLPGSWPVALTILVTATAFAVLHLFSNLGAPLSRWAELLLFGLLFGALYARTRSIWLISGLHWGIDFGSFFYFGGKEKVPGEPYQFWEVEWAAGRERQEHWIGTLLVGALALLLSPIWL